MLAKRAVPLEAGERGEPSVGSVFVRVDAGRVAVGAAHPLLSRPEPSPGKTVCVKTVQFLLVFGVLLLPAAAGRCPQRSNTLNVNGDVN